MGKSLIQGAAHDRKLENSMFNELRISSRTLFPILGENPQKQIHLSILQYYYIAFTVFFFCFNCMSINTWCSHFPYLLEFNLALVGLGVFDIHQAVMGTEKLYKIMRMYAKGKKHSDSPDLKTKNCRGY